MRKTQASGEGEEGRRKNANIFTKTRVQRLFPFLAIFSSSPHAYSPPLLRFVRSFVHTHTVCEEDHTYAQIVSAEEARSARRRSRRSGILAPKKSARRTRARRLPPRMRTAARHRPPRKGTRAACDSKQGEMAKGELPTRKRVFDLRDKSAYEINKKHP